VPYCFDVRFRTPRPVAADKLEEMFKDAERPLRFYRPDGMNRHDGWLAVESCGYADFGEAKASGALLQEGLLIVAAKQKVGVELYLRGAVKAINVYPEGRFELRDPGLPLPTPLSDDELKEMMKAVTLDNQILRITHLPWHFGGNRSYFLCDCGRRVGTLYRPPGHPWRCRKCYQLTYATRQAAPRQRLILKAQKVREQLGGKLGVLDVFPDKPKGMHWRRYDRLRRFHDQAVENSLAMLSPYITRLSHRVGLKRPERDRPFALR
jgi:hypothetical protein